MSKSEQHLRDAFAGESQANRKYLAFAAKADKEGYPQVAKLFRAAGAAETVHAHAHLRALGEIGKTADNLKVAVAGETHEFKHMYPGMIADAKEEGNKAAERSFVLCQRGGAGPCRSSIRMLWTTWTVWKKWTTTSAVCAA